MKSLEKLLLNSKLKIFLTLFVILISFNSYFKVIQNLKEFSSHYGIIYAFDSDSAQSLDSTKNSGLFKDNHYYPYGPLFYKITNSVWTLSLNSNKEELTSEQEKTLHFIILLTGFFSFLILCFYISHLMAARFLYEKLILTYFLFWIFLDRKEFSDYIFRAKPDHTMAFFILISTHICFSALKDKFNFSKLKLGAVFWGATLSFKMTAGLNLLSLTPLFYLHIKKYKDLFKFGFILLVSYFAIGIPQNFKLHENYKFFTQVGSYLEPTTIGWVKAFLGAYDIYFILSLCIIIFLTDLNIITKKEETKISANEKWAYLFLIYIPIFQMLYFMKNKLLMVYTHYHIPIQITWVYVVIQLTLKFRPYFHYEILNKIKPNLKTMTFLLMLLVIFFKPFPNMYLDAFQKRIDDPCRKEALLISNRINELLIEDSKLLITPYVPYERFSNREKVLIKHDIGLTDLNNYSHLVVKKTFYERFLENPVAQKTIYDFPETYKAASEFFKILNTQTQFKDSKNRLWQKTTELSCGWQVWEII